MICALCLCACVRECVSVEARAWKVFANAVLKPCTNFFHHQCGDHCLRARSAHFEKAQKVPPTGCKFAGRWRLSSSDGIVKNTIGNT